MRAWRVSGLPASLYPIVQLDTELSQTTIAAINGVINQPMTNGSTYLLPRLIGEGRAKLLGMTGEIIAAEEAERIGLVNSVVEDQRLTSAVEELVAKLVSVGPIAVACVKECFARSRDVDVDAAVMFENEAATRCFVSADQQEGLQAFLEKREPRWSGR
jgi:enoyl-CoA hydratase/carnithine racemase